MRKLLTFLLVLGAIIALTVMAGALAPVGPSAGFRNPGNVEIGGDVSVGDDLTVAGDTAITGGLTVGGATVSNGVFSEDISMAAGYDFRTAVGASVFDWSNGTGPFKTSTGAVTIGGGNNGITLNGPITGASAKDWTMVGASKLTIGSTGIQAVGGTITFLNDTSFSGAIASSSGTFSATVQAEQLTSTDDASVADDLTVLGSVGVTETVQAEQLTSSDDATIGDALDVVGALTAGTVASDAGITAVTTIQAEQLTSTDDITATDDVNAHDLVVTADVGTATVTASGQVQAEHLYSTDDAYIADNALVLGDATVTGATTTGTLAVNTTSDLNGLVSAAGVTLDADTDLTIQGTGDIVGVTAGFSGAIYAEDVRSTDDAYVADNLLVLGDLTTTGATTTGTLAVNTTSDLNGLVSAAGVTLDADTDLTLQGTGDIVGVTAGFSGAIYAEDVRSTDDAYIADDLLILGLAKVTETATVNALVSNTTISGEDVASTDDIYIADDALVLGLVQVAETATVNALISNTTISGEDVTSTDDAYIADDLLVLGDQKTTGSTTTQTAVINDTLAVTTADKLTVGGVIVPQEMVLSWPVNANSVDENIFIASDAWEVTHIEEAHAVAGNDVGAVTVSLMVCDGTEAPSAGDAAQSAAFDIKGAANTVQTGTLSATKTLADGNRLALDYTGTLTTLAGGAVTVHLKRV